MCGRRGIGGGDDEGGDLLAPFGVGETDDADGGDGGVVEEEALDLGRINILATSNDNIATSLDEPEITILIEIADVAGVETAIA